MTLQDHLNAFLEQLRRAYEPPAMTDEEAKQAHDLVVDLIAKKMLVVEQPKHCRCGKENDAQVSTCWWCGGQFR